MHSSFNKNVTNSTSRQRHNYAGASIKFSGNMYTSELANLKKLSKENLARNNYFGDNLITFSKEKLRLRSKVAKLSYDTCLDLKNLGYIVPKIVIDSNLFRFRKLFGIAENSVAFYNPILGKNKIFITRNMPVNSEYVAHEAAHYLHCRKNPVEYIRRNIDDAYDNSRYGFDSEKDFIKTEISSVLQADKVLNIEEMAEYFTNSEAEFVAFYFQKAVHGHIFSDKMKSLYEFCDGPEIKGIIPHRK